MKWRIAPVLAAGVGLFLGVISAEGERLILVAGGGALTNVTEPVPAIQARLSSPFGVDFDRAGNLILVEMTGQRVRKIDEAGRMTVIAGSGVKGDDGDGGPAMAAQFNGMHNLAIAPNGDIYLADTWNNRVRRIDANSGRITTVAGTGEKGFSGDGGLATAAKFGGIYCASLDARAEHLYLADLDNRRIRQVNLSSGLVRTVAGNGQKGVPADGATATEAPLVDPRAVIADVRGQIYILERGGHALRLVNEEGKIRTLAGTGSKGFSGDNGDGRHATLNGPKHLCFDLQGNILVADTENHVIRKYSLKDGRITRVAGTGRAGASGLGGPPLQAELKQPHGVYVHRDGTLYISDSGNHRVLKVVP